jgi:glycosyltransferase involved in cell wall biosynthesis
MTRIALLGGVPSSLGGGGLEVQVDRTRRALAARGLSVFHVALAAKPQPFDVLHAFGAEPDVWHFLGHWRRNPAPLVVSPVVVAAPGFEERAQLLAARIPLRSLAPRMRAEVVRRADVCVALTASEAAFLRRLGARRVEVIPNGVDPAVSAAAPPLPDRFALLLGTVSARKRQREIVDALRGSIPVVVAGGFEGGEAERSAFAAAVEATGGAWLGEVPPEVARAVVRRASPRPAQRELAAAHPGWVRLAATPAEVPAALTTLSGERGPAPEIPTWDDVAARLETVYASLRPAAGSPGTAR